MFFCVLFQVKVWFQNRRTKHKRTAQEENEHRRKSDKSESESEYVDVESPVDSPPDSPLSLGMEGDYEVDSDCPSSPSGYPLMGSHPHFTPTTPSSSSSSTSLGAMPPRFDSHNTHPHTNVYTHPDSQHIHSKVV